MTNNPAPTPTVAEQIEWMEFHRFPSSLRIVDAILSTLRNAAEMERALEAQTHALKAVERLLGVFCPNDFLDQAKGERVAAAFSHAQVALIGDKWHDSFDAARDAQVQP